MARPAESAYLWKTVRMASPNDMARGPFDWHAEDLGDLECALEVWGDTPLDRKADLVSTSEASFVSGFCAVRVGRASDACLPLRPAA